MDLWAAIKRNRHLVVGRAGIDLFTDPGVALEDAQTVNLGLGGSAANIAAGICKLGGKASLLTCVSDDGIGSYCLDQLVGYGVGAEYVRAVAGENRNSLALYESRVEGHRSVIYRNGAADFQMDQSDVQRVDFDRFSGLITAGTVFAAEPSRSAAFHAMERAHQAGLPVIFDIDYRPYSWPSAEMASRVLSRAAEQSDVIVGNDEEFAFLGDGLSSARGLARNERLVVYKMGPKGAVTFWQGEEIRTGIYAVEAMKPTGAGDSFLAGLLTSIADGHALKSAILRGSACASITVSRPGCAPAMPTPQELAAFLSTHPGPQTG
ncbi:permease [Actibacterium mucosum KCTC 23349]|uniref:Permease n=1 Tax=Actibacterium mucosum KCTC 23349 TaxID=1454373 RepID=A0A037ZII7_9RHOB|nr:permease [Actibacterium mucosum KCTC 23349]